MALPLILAGLSLGATVFGAINQYEQGQAQAEALREQAELDLLRANEFLIRTEKNIAARKIAAEKIIGGQQVALAKSGIELGTGVSLDIMEDAYMSLAEEEDLIRSEADYQAASIISGAESTRKQAGDVSSAGTISAVTTLLGGIGRLRT